MGITIDEAITRYKDNAEYERTHGNLQGCLEFKQLAKWLEKLQKIEKIINAPIGGTSAKYNAIVNLIKYSEVDNGIDD